MTVNEGEYLFIYNSNSINDKRTKSYVISLDEVKVNERDIYKDPLTPTQIAEVAGMLNVAIKDLYNEDGDSAGAFTEDEILRILTKDPQKMKTPIILSKEKCFFVDSSYDLIKENVQEFANTENNKN